MNKDAEVDYDHHDDVDLLPLQKQMRETCPVSLQ